MAVNSFEATNSIFNIIDENKSFSVSTPSHRNSEDGEELINKLNSLLDLRSENDIKLHVKEVGKRGTRTERENSGYNLAGFDHFKTDMLEGMKRIKYNDLEDMVYRMELSYDEIVDIVDVKYIAGSTIGYIIPPAKYEITDINWMIKSLLPNKIKVKITIDDIRLISNLATNNTIGYTKRSFFNAILGFTLSHSGPLGDIKGFIQKIPGTYKSDKPINITGIDKIHLKCDCINGSIVNGVRDPILYNFALDQPPGPKNILATTSKTFLKDK